jgi:hypothetical protein
MECLTCSLGLLWGVSFSFPFHFSGLLGNGTYQGGYCAPMVCCVYGVDYSSIRLLSTGYSLLCNFSRPTKVRHISRVFCARSN